MVVTSAVAAGLVLVYRFLCVWENKKRDKAGTLEAFEHAYEDDLTDIKVKPNYIPPSGPPSLSVSYHTPGRPGQARRLTCRLVHIEPAVSIPTLTAKHSTFGVTA